MFHEARAAHIAGWYASRGIDPASARVWLDIRGRRTVKLLHAKARR